jgi:hypothetical protein
MEKMDKLAQIEDYRINRGGDEGRRRGNTTRETLSAGQGDGGLKNGRGNRIPPSKKATLHRETGAIPAFNPCLSALYSSPTFRK